MCVCLYVDKDWDELCMFVVKEFGFVEFVLWDVVYVVEKFC